MQNEAIESILRKVKNTKPEYQIKSSLCKKNKQTYEILQA